MLLSAENISKNYGTKQILGGVTLYLEAGHKVGIIGINGTGKSTLMKILAGETDADSGSLRPDPGVRLAYLSQDPAFSPADTVLSYTLGAFPKEERESREFEAKAMLNRMGVGFFDRDMSTLSGGQRKRVALSKVLLTPSDVLLLDEPTNHLDMGMILYLEAYLRQYRGGLIMVTHDRYFLQNVCNRIVELSLAETFEYEANWEKYLELKAERLESAQASERKRLAMLRDEEEWMKRGARARGTKAKAHIDHYESLANAKAPQLEQQQGAISAGYARLGKKTISLENVSFGYETPLVHDFTYTILRDDRIGIIGKNGSGKSTLLNLISGDILPASGTVEMGTTVKVGYFRQGNQDLDPNERAIDYIRDIAISIETSEGRMSATMMMEQFLFGSDLQYAPIGKLSGGEKRRLYLLGILMSAPNVLLLDEPTNDLDVTTLTILEHYLQSFQGPIIAVSHDRYFLDKIASNIFEVEGNGRINRYIGGYSDCEPMLKEREAEAQPKAQAPKKEAAEKPRERKFKMSYNDKRDYETIEARIAETEAKIAATEAEMLNCASSYMKLSELTEEKEKLEQQLDALTERWLELEELKAREEQG